MKIEPVCQDDSLWKILMYYCNVWKMNFTLRTLKLTDLEFSKRRKQRVHPLMLWRMLSLTDFTVKWVNLETCFKIEKSSKMIRWRISFFSLHAHADHSNSITPITIVTKDGGTLKSMHTAGTAIIKSVGTMHDVPIAIGTGHATTSKFMRQRMNNQVIYTCTEQRKLASAKYKVNSVTSLI